LAQPQENELLKTLLEPLLEDFQYWFSRSRALLESENISFLNADEQTQLLARIETAQQEVKAAKMLFNATDGQAGIKTATLLPWHRLVTECWQVASRWRTLKNSA